MTCRANIEFNMKTGRSTNDARYIIYLIPHCITINRIIIIVLVEIDIYSWKARCIVYPVTTKLDFSNLRAFFFFFLFSFFHFICFVGVQLLCLLMIQTLLHIHMNFFNYFVDIICEWKLGHSYLLIFINIHIYICVILMRG